ncbi:hypothetical protein H5410_019116 [Solanum commersonii]|uniref:Uncharacterized protein n=1 Tax=Solanum commersonii TaxID=4109 RepID=A0A9J6A515_SOLCO|nr:hypothetical protein H5410_019116 [Solanum commersonii]
MVEKLMVLFDIITGMVSNALPITGFASPKGKRTKKGVGEVIMDACRRYQVLCSINGDVLKLIRAS